MNCEGFEGVISDLTRSHLIEASLRDEALLHAGSCGRCETRLADESELTAGLHELATVWSGEAPAHVETSLLAAFREQRTNVARVASTPRTTPRWLYVAAGVAALVVIVLMLSLTLSRTRESAEQRKPESAVTAPPAADKQNDAMPKSSSTAVAGPRPEAGRSDGFRTFGAHGNQDRKRGRRRPYVELIPDAEIATEFFPLNREGIGQIDSAQVVRVELPRSAMMSFGLPMNMDRADERIKADVVVGNDGVARAIRFVR